MMTQSQIIYPLCGQCNEPIRDKIVQAMGQTFHEDHFYCTHCKQPIKEPVFAVKQGKPYCRDDYTQLFSKMCSSCGEKIKNVAVIAKDKYWHQNCFICYGCRRPLKEGYYEKNDNPYCKDCYISRFSSKCKKCDQSIRGEVIIAMGSRYHPDCFRCNHCQNKITDTFKLVNNLLICVKCSQYLSSDTNHQRQREPSHIIRSSASTGVAQSFLPAAADHKKASSDIPPSPDIPRTSDVPASSFTASPHETPKISIEPETADDKQEIQEPSGKQEPSGINE